MGNKKSVDRVNGIIQILLFSCVITPALAGKKVGAFNDADFIQPENGAVLSLNTGDSLTFDFQCTCANRPGRTSCSGEIRLDMNMDGSGFLSIHSSSCSAAENQSCSGSYNYSFSNQGNYQFRITCDEQSGGSDFVQPAEEYVSVTAVATACGGGETRPCGNGIGVCEGAVETCIDGVWSACDYGDTYESPERSCDNFDNDCDGFIDNVDSDQDGSSACLQAPGPVNELLITGLQKEPGRLSVLVYNPEIADYEIEWQTDSEEVTSTYAGGEIGDLTHDGINDFLISRGTGDNSRLEIWTYEPAGKAWNPVWMMNSNSVTYNGIPWVGDIGDFDGDGFEEFLVTNMTAGNVEVWGDDSVDASNFRREAVISTIINEIFIKAAGDLNGNGMPEILAAPYRGSTVNIYEYQAGQYVLQDSIDNPPAYTGTDPMIVDDGETGDVNRDGRDDYVFCGNSERVHVLTYDLEYGVYLVEYTSEVIGDGDHSFTQTCSIGDVTNDGFNDIVVGSKNEVAVFSYGNTDESYFRVWSGDPGTDDFPPGIGASFIGDADNDGRAEFFMGGDAADPLWLFESDLENANSFELTYSWVYSRGTVAVGNLNPFNDGDSIDCDDENPDMFPGNIEICGDGIDQDCDGNDPPCDCRDQDKDSFFALNAATCPNGNDCNDFDKDIYPGAVEICTDGLDNDCDGLFDCDDADCLGDGACSVCLPKGSGCSSNTECCSNKCLPSRKCK